MLRIAAVALLAAAGLCQAQGAGERLEAAVRAGDQAAVKRELDARANPNHATATGTPMLVLATNMAGAEVANLLVDRGANVRGRTKFGRTALHAAATFGRLDLIERYRKAGADLNDADNPGREAPLHSAVYGQQYEVIDLLAERGAFIDARNSNDNSPLQLAVLLNQNDDRMPAIVALLRNKANPNVANSEGNMPLHMAVGVSGRAPSANAARALLEHGAWPHPANREGRSPQALALESGKPELQDLFLKPRGAQAKGMSVNYNVGEPIAAGERKVYTLYIPYEAQRGGLHIRLKFGGKEAMAMRVESPGLVRSSRLGWHWLRVPEGGRQLSFLLVAPARVAGASHLGVSTSIVNEDGEPTHASHLQMVIEVKP